MESDVRAHPFLSNHKAISKEMESAPDLLSSGIKVTLGVRVDPKTGLVDGFSWKEAENEDNNELLSPGIEVLQKPRLLAVA